MLEVRPLGKTGFSVSEIGLSLAGDAARVAVLARRAYERGVRLLHVDRDELIDAVRVSADMVVAAPDGDVRVRSLAEIRSSCGDPRSMALCADAGDLGLALALAGGVGGVLVPFNPAEQQVAELLPRAGKAGLGIIGVSALAGGAFAGRAAKHPLPAVVQALRPLATPRRSLVQVAIQFAVANMHLQSVVVRVSSEEHLDEVVGALDAEPLTIADLERIFEIYAHRNDDDPSRGCGR
jgi:aryl-alcohol dehydrogenase-like predicted oxidoreductase